MNTETQIDRPFLDKFNNSTFFGNINELHNSIASEIANILSANIRISGNLDELPSIEINPCAYGTRDLQSLLDATEIHGAFIEHCRQQILSLEPRISNCEITNASVDHIRQFVSFDITYSTNKVDTQFTTTIQLRT